MSLKVSGECFISRADLRFIPSGTAVCKFSIKTSRKDKKTDEWISEWFNGVSWKGVAETVATYGDGQKVKIEGILSSHSYEARDGTKKTATEVVCFQVEPVGEIKQKEALDLDSIPF